MSKICSLRGISAPQLTPFREDGSINYGEYTRLTQFITDAGVHGVFVCGTTGEFVNLTLEERKRRSCLTGPGMRAPTRRRSPRPITTAMTPRL